MRVLQGHGVVPFKMLREKLPMLSAMTLDQLGAKMKCNKCGIATRAILSCEPERHARICSKLLDATELFGRLRRVRCFIAPQGERPIAIEASKRAGLIAAGCHHQDQFVPALRARRNGDQISRHSVA
jgi:hypothetical protein